MLTALQAVVEAAVVHAATNPTAMRLAEAASVSDPIANLLQYGVLGLVVVGFMSRWIVTGAEAKALSAENTRLAGVIEGQLFPMLEQYGATMEKAAAALERAADVMQGQAERDRAEQRERR